MIVVITSIACQEVSVVSSVRPVQEWQFSSQPLVVIGQVDGARPEYSLEAVSDVRLLPDGGIAIADGRRAIKVFGPSGAYRFSFGRLGDGPGEFRFLDRLLWQGDSALVIFDSGRLRLLRFDLQGEFLEGTPVLGPPLHRVVVAEEGGIFGLSRWTITDEGEDIVTRRYPSDLVRVDADGNREVLSESEGPMLTVQRGSYFFTAFGPRSSIVAYGDGVALTRGDRPEVEVYSPDGEVSTVIETSRSDVPLSRPTIDAWISARQEFFEGRGVSDPDAVLPFGEEPDWPSNLPVYRRLFNDQRGCIWAEVFTPEGEPPEFDVVSPSRGHLARVVGPARVRVREVRGNRIATVATDDLGVQRVQVWTIHGPESDEPQCRRR